MINRTTIAWCILLGCLTGCDGLTRPQLRLQYLPDRQQPVPAADLPLDLRVKNWIGTNDRGSRGGSCFWASMWMCIRASGRIDIEQLLAENLGNGFEGPEHLLSMCRKLDSIGVPFVATEDGDIRLLEEASRTRRWTSIAYYPGHAICFVGFYTLNDAAIYELANAGVPIVTGSNSQQHWRYATPRDLADLRGQEVAILLDNNFPDKYIVVEPRQRFEVSWIERYDGIAVTPWLSPIMPHTYPRTQELR